MLSFIRRIAATRSCRLAGYSLKSAGLVLGILVTLATVPACNSLTAAGSSSTLTVAVSPNPVTAQPSTLAGYTWNASFSIVVTDSAGVGASVRFVTATVHEVINGSAVTSNVVSHVDVNNSGERIAANGSASIPCSIDFALPGGGRTAGVDLSVTALDDNGNSDAAAASVSIN